MHRRVGTAEAYSGHCFAALMKERRENGVRVEKIVELQVNVAHCKKLWCINTYDTANLNFPRSQTFGLFFASKKTEFLTAKLFELHCKCLQTNDR